MVLIIALFIIKLPTLKKVKNYKFSFVIVPRRYKNKTSTYRHIFLLVKQQLLKVYEKLLLALKNSHLLLTNVLMVGSDGPNVNNTVFRKINEQVLLFRGKGFI